MKSWQEETNVTITHFGNVSKIRGDSVFVVLNQNVHCTSCQAKSACGVSEKQTKELEIINPNESFRINERVQVILKKGDGMNAIFWAYVLPFLLLMVVLLSTSALLPEWQAGVLALLILVPYYLGLRLLDAYFKKRMQVFIEKVN